MTRGRRLKAKAAKNPMRRHIVVLTALLVSLCFSSATLEAIVATPPGTSPSIEEAKKEGRFIYYTSTNLSLANELIKAFNRKYPFLKTEVFRLGGEALLNKVLLEAQTGRLQADVIQLSDFRAYVLKKKRLVARYLSAEHQNIREEFRDPDGLGTFSFGATVMGYNSRLIDPQEVPKSYDDLLSAKWKGRLGMDMSDFKWFIGQLQIMGEEKGLEYMRNLSRQQPHGRRGGTLAVQLLAAGEFPVGVNLDASSIEVLKSEGAPLDWVAVQPVLATPQMLGVSATAPHPNAAKLFVDFALSREGVDVLRRFKKISPRKDFEPDPPRLTRGLKFFPLPVDLAEQYERYDRLYREIFYRN